MGEPSPFKHERADDSAGFLLWKITTLWQQRLAGVLGEFGITQTQYAILASLCWFDEQRLAPTQADLVAHTKLDKMTLSKAGRRLEDDGLLRRTPSSVDARSVNVALTPAGRKLAFRAIQGIEKADDVFFASLSPQQLIDYKRLTLKLVAANA